MTASPAERRGAEGSGAERPGFQFYDGGRPLPVAREVCATVADRLHGWTLALWFTGADGWLDGARPVDLLIAAPGDVVEAAQ